MRTSYSNPTCEDQIYTANEYLQAEYSTTVHIARMELSHSRIRRPMLDPSTIFKSVSFGNLARDSNRS